VVETPQGPAILDINDFPSFGRVPRAVVRISEYVLHAAKRAEMQRETRLARARQRRESLLRKKEQQSSYPSLKSIEPIAFNAFDKTTQQNLAGCICE
jgi:hypothetical protein